MIRSGGRVRLCQDEAVFCTVLQKGLLVGRDVQLRSFDSGPFFFSSSLLLCFYGIRRCCGRACFFPPFLFFFATVHRSCFTLLFMLLSPVMNMYLFQIPCWGHQRFLVSRPHNRNDESTSVRSVATPCERRREDVDYVCLSYPPS